MPRRHFRLSLLLPLIACAGAPGERTGTGRLRLERDGALLVEAPASASRCAADSTIAIVAIGGEWIAALALRVAWPLDAALQLPIVTAGRPGSASLAARPVADSVGLAVIGTRGVVHLEPGATLTGRFDAEAPTMPGAPDSVRITGRLEGVRIADDLCPADSSRSSEPVN